MGRESVKFHFWGPMKLLKILSLSFLATGVVKAEPPHQEETRSTKNATPLSVTPQQQSSNKQSEVKSHVGSEKQLLVSAPEVSEQVGGGQLFNSCVQQLKELPGKRSLDNIRSLCQDVEHLNGCYSVKNEPLFHGDYITSRKNAKKILVLAVIHGDESMGGTVAKRWMTRLGNINSRSSWRIVPVLNPDGMRLKTRMNQNRVDINRNFPTSDWDTHALKYWKEKKKSDVRRYPGPSAASEPETRCVVKHINDFKPDFIIAIHTPYGVLDFDGPRVSFPKFREYPWVSLGTFPGSLGRYMWKDRKIPVLTVELKDDSFLKKIDRMDTLQDTAGTVALRASQKLQNSRN